MIKLPPVLLKPRSDDARQRSQAEATSIDGCNPKHIGLLQMANPFFNAKYYLENNKDVADSGLDPEAHYLQFGAKEGRAPTAWFNAAYYLFSNPDLEKGGITIDTAFAHFQAFGANEGRSPSPTVSLVKASLSGYAAANPDLVKAFGITDPAYLSDAQAALLAVHFYQFGHNEGRPGNPTVSPVGGTFTLTTGADDLTGTAGNDVFTANQALVGSTLTDTLQNVDLLNGGGGADTLKATISGDVTAATTSIETIEIRNIAVDGAGAGVAKSVAISKDVTSVVEANSVAGVTFTGAAGVTSVTSGGVRSLDVKGIEAAAVTVKVAKAADAATNTVTLQSVNTKAAALSALNVDVKGTVTVAAQNDHATTPADTVKTLSVKANGAGTYKAAGTSTADSLTFADTDVLATATITGTGDLVANLGTTQAKLTSFDASGLAGGVVFTGTNKLDGHTDSVLATVKGGSGNDILAVANLKDGATVDLGAGDNKLVLTASKGGVTVAGGAGKDDITLANVAGKATVINTGAGNDKLTITTPNYTTASTTLTVDLGEGDDFVNAGNLAGAISTINFQGGAGTDTIRITGDFGLAEANRIEGFEVVDVTGNTGATGLDLSREASINAVVLTAGAATAKILNAAAGTTITAKDGAVGTLSFALADDTGTDDVAKVTLSADDSANKTGIADTAKQAELGLTANKIETVQVNSTALPGVGDATAATPIKANKASDYTNTLTLTGNEVKTVVVTGNAKLDLVTTTTAPKLATIDATGNSAGVKVSLANANAVTFNGGSGADNITSTVGHMIVKAGAGADTYALKQGAAPADDVKDTIVITSAADTQLATKAHATTGALELDFTKMDVITSFGDKDKIDLSAFGFTGARTDAFVTATISTANVDLLGLVKNGQANFFVNGSVNAGVAALTIGADTYLAIDANKDGNFSAADDAVILIGAVTGIDAADVIWAA
ncbi:hypothetical protein EKL30_09865 [Candidimonas sp. SYP-B2681]|uniref:beta strand repeat-containing protein n=1 Tax=Candidimonas sp. SYP-B2681 TaxID=2497686 RepID=UPI000F871F88|nr:hypothetical protein [Candidimonas sp. SYP-B2681]RTZ43182.1 hypothetical protein EKL30_09865 [Candidimonas sp. SYP-B2681]